MFHPVQGRLDNGRYYEYMYLNDCISQCISIKSVKNDKLPFWNGVCQVLWRKHYLLKPLYLVLDFCLSIKRYIPVLADKIIFLIFLLLTELGFNDNQPLWVILCRLPEKGRREIEKIVEGRKERDRGERKLNESEGKEEIKTFPLYSYPLQGHQVLPNCKPIRVICPGDVRYMIPLPHPNTQPHPTPIFFFFLL